MTITSRLRAIATHESCEHYAKELIEAAGTLERREAVVRFLEHDARAANARAANALGTRKVLWNLLGECLPLLKIDAQWSTDYEGKEAIEELIQRINDARDRRAKTARFIMSSGEYDEVQTLNVVA